MNEREIEQAVLKKCLYSPDHLSRIQKLGNVFQFPEHIELYNIVTGIYADDRKIDAMLLSSIILKDQPQYLSNSYVAEMATPVRDELFDEYVNRIMESYIGRELEQTFVNGRGSSPKELLFHLTEKLMNLETNTTEVTNQEYCKKQAREMMSPPVDDFVRCGINFFDDVCGGFANTDLIIIAARPGGGKTHKMISIMEFMSRNDIPIGCFSIEEPADMIFKKMACSRAGIDTIRMRQGKLEQMEKGRLQEYLGKMYERKIVIDEDPFLYSEDLLTRALRMKKRHGIRALFVDYFADH
jgi:replicative DNA helicase